MTTKSPAKLVVLGILLMLTALSVLLSCDRRRAVNPTGTVTSSKVANVIVYISPNVVFLSSAQSVDTVGIAVAVTDSNGLGMSGIKVNLSRSPNTGVLIAADTTNSEGVAAGGFVTEPGVYDSIAVTATAGNVSKSATLYITGPSRYSLNLTVSPSVPKLIDHQGDPYTISAVLVDSTQRGVSGQAVNFTIINSVGRIGFSDPDITVPYTNSSGEVQALFFNTEDDEQHLPTTATVLAVTAAPDSGLLGDTVNIALRPVQNTLQLVATPNQIVSDGSTEIQVRAHLRDTDSHSIVGDTVKFRNLEGDGPIPASAVTNESGIASVIFTPASRVNQQQQSHVIADYRLGSPVHQAVCTTAVSLMPVRAVGYITVSAQKQNITANGLDNSLLFITVQDSLGSLIADGTPIYCSHSGSGDLSVTQTSTTGGGATISITGPTSTSNIVDSIFVRSTFADTSASTIADTVVVYYVPGDVYALEFIRPTTGTVTMVAGSGRTDTVEVRATDAFGNNVLNGTQIRFNNTLTSSTLAPSTAPTDSGIARAIYLVGPVIGDDNVTAFIRDPITDGDTIWTSSPIIFHCISSNATTMDLRASSPNIEIGGQSTQIIATLQDAFGNPLSADYRVAFDITVAPPGCDSVDWRPSFNTQTLVEHDTVLTNVSGQAVIQLYSGCHSGAVAIRACTVPEPPEWLYVCNEKSLVTISSGPANWITLSLEGAGETAGGAVRFVQVAAIVGDRYSNPVDYGTAVYFTLIPSDLADIEGNSTTGTPRPYHSDSTNGVAYTRIIYSCFDTFKRVQIVASSAGDSAEVVDTSAVFVLPIYGGVLAIGASPGNLWIDTCMCRCYPPSLPNGRQCRDTTLITVALRDGGGCPIADGLIGFTAQVAGFIIPPDMDTTDVNGEAEARYYIRGCDIPNHPDGTRATIETSVRATLQRVSQDVSAEVDIVCGRPPGPCIFNIQE